MNNLRLGILCNLPLIPALLLATLPFLNLIGRRDRNAMWALCGGALFLNMLLWVEMGKRGRINIAFYKRDLLMMGVILTACSLLFLHTHLRERIFTIGLMLLLFLAVYATGAFIMGRIGPMPMARALLWENVIGLVLFLALFRPFAHLITETVSPFLNDENADDENYWKTIWLLPLVMFIGLNFATRMDSFITTVAELIGRISIVVVTVMLCRNVSLDARRHREQEQLRRQVSQQKENYEALVEKVKAERKERHNFRHQLATVQTMVKAGNTEELLRYCDEAEAALGELSDVPLTGNTAADSILYHYASIAQKEEIAFSVKGGFGAVRIPDGDIICLLGNALDNAFAGCRTIEKGRYVNVAILQRDDSLMITVDNSFDGVVLRDGGRIYSRKRKHEEGFGILSMKEIVDKYGGISKFGAKGREFEASFLMNAAG